MVPKAYDEDMRWCVEEYHKAHKSGAGAEDSPMERAYRIESLVAVLGVVEVRLFNTKWLARTRPNESVNPKVFGPRNEGGGGRTGRKGLIDDS